MKQQHYYFASIVVFLASALIWGLGPEWIATAGFVVSVFFAHLAYLAAADGAGVKASI